MNMKRMRGRNHRSGGGGTIRHNSGQVPLNRNHVFDSNGPDMRLRGTAQQLFEKYLQLGRDASSSDDRVAAEGYFQHAEHYFRIVNAMAQAAQQNQHGQHQNNGQHQGGQGGQGGQQNGAYNQRRFADPEEGEDEADSQPRTQNGNGNGAGRDGQQGRDFGHRDRNREFNRDQPRESYRNDGQRSDGQREPYGRERDQRFRQPVAQPASQVVDEVAQSSGGAVMRPVEDLGSPAPVEIVPHTAVREAPQAAEIVSAPTVDAAGEPAPAAPRAPRAPRTRRRPAAASAGSTADRGAGDQPELSPAPSLTAVED